MSRSLAARVRGGVAHAVKVSRERRYAERSVGQVVRGYQLAEDPTGRVTRLNRGRGVVEVSAVYYATDSIRQVHFPVDEAVHPIAPTVEQSRTRCKG